MRMMLSLALTCVLTLTVAAAQTEVGLTTSAVSAEPAAVADVTSLEQTLAATGASGGLAAEAGEAASRMNATAKRLADDLEQDRLFLRRTLPELPSGDRMLVTTGMRELLAREEALVLEYRALTEQVGELAALAARNSAELADTERRLAGLQQATALELEAAITATGPNQDVERLLEEARLAKLDQESQAAKLTALRLELEAALKSQGNSVGALSGLGTALGKFGQLGKLLTSKLTRKSEPQGAAALLAARQEAVAELVATLPEVRASVAQLRIDELNQRLTLESKREEHARLRLDTRTRLVDALRHRVGITQAEVSRVEKESLLNSAEAVRDRRQAKQVTVQAEQKREEARQGQEDVAKKEHELEQAAGKGEREELLVAKRRALAEELQLSDDKSALAAEHEALAKLTSALADAKAFLGAEQMAHTRALANAIGDILADPENTSAVETEYRTLTVSAAQLAQRAQEVTRQVELAGQAKELVARRRKLTLERNLKGRQEFEKASFPSIESDTLKALEGQQRVVEERLTLIERRLGLLQEQAGVLKTLAKFYAENLDTLERYRRTAEKKVTATSFAEVYSVVNDGVMALPAWLRSIPTETRLWWSSSENRERARQRAAAAGVVLALALLLYVAGLWWLRRWPAAAGSRSLLLELAHGVLLPMVLYGATRGLVAWDPSLPRGAARFAVFFAFLALYRVLRASAEHVANRYPPCDPFRPWAVWALRYWIALWFVADFLSGVGASKALVFLAWALLKLGLFLLALGCLHVNREPLLAISRVAEEGRLARWGRYYNDRVPQLYLGGLVFLLVVGAAGIAGYEELAGTIMRRSFLSLLLAIGSMSLVRLALHGLQRLLSGLPENRRNSLLEPLGTALGVAAGGLAVLLLVDLWVPSVSAWRLLTSEAVTVAGKRVLGCLLLGGLAVLASRLASFSLQVFGHALLARVGSEAAVRRQRTLTPLLESMAKLAIYCVAALLILRELGFDPTPILAGAGVLGLAIGFGAQSLVKDVITGFFILAEDLISVGDVVDLDGKIGLVEAMTVRTTKLRFFSGELRTIPNSEIRQIGNWNRGFMRAVITIGVAYESNIEKAMKVLLELAWDYHRQHLDIMLAAPEVHGILEFGSSDIKIRAVFMVKPMKQWDVEREFKRLLKQAFDEHGIEIPFNRQVVYLRQDTAAERTPEPPEPPAEPQPQS